MFIEIVSVSMQLQGHVSLRFGDQSILIRLDLSRHEGRMLRTRRCPVYAGAWSTKDPTLYAN